MFVSIPSRCRQPRSAAVCRLLFTVTALTWLSCELDVRGQSTVDTTAGLTALKKRIEDKVATEYERLDELYKHFHSHPELSLQEEQTAARLAKELRAVGAEVTERIGGFGVVGVVKNGDGPVVMVRADMDALPIVENTGLPYASRVRQRNADGQEMGVMHACGHDINITCLVGTAKIMTALKADWKGTLLLVGQPAEEIGAGARRMLADGLFDKFPKPQRAFALHCDGRYPHGHINFREGQMQANVDSVDIIVRGKGGHGAAPHLTVDPILLASKIVVDLQAIVSRELDPLDAAVVTVGSFHGGTKHNIIPAEVKLQLTVRTTNDVARQKVLQAIDRKVKAAATGAGAPEPVVKVDPAQFTPALVNDAELTRATVAMLRAALGSERVHERPMSLGGEDFSQFVNAGIPGFYFFLGSVPPERVAEAKAGGRPLAVTHSDAYFPIPEPTIKTGVLAMSLTLLTTMAK